MVSPSPAAAAPSIDATRRKLFIGIVMATLVALVAVIADLASGGRPDPPALRAAATLLDGPWRFHVGDDPRWADAGSASDSRPSPHRWRSEGAEHPSKGAGNILIGGLIARPVGEWRKAGSCHLVRGNARMPKGPAIATAPRSCHGVPGAVYAASP